MKKLFQVFILLFVVKVGFAQTLTQMRCYFDGDEGSAQYFSLGDVAEISAPFDVDVSTLSKGVHQLYLEVMDNSNSWSLYDMKAIQVIGGIEMATLNAMEYFYDTDPGFGNGTQVAVSGLSFEQEFELSITGLNAGLHMLYVRTRDGAGQWSLTTSRLLQVVATGYTEITAAEYFFDTDPGFNGGSQIPLSDFSVDEDLDLSIIGMQQGVHHLYIRVMDAAGQWSLYAHHILQVEGGMGYHEVVEAEYFFDVDPGFGNALTIAIPTSTSFDGNFDLAIPDELALGSHIVYVRVRDGSNQWSLYACDTLNVCDIIVPAISASGGECEGDIQTLSVEDTYISYLWSTNETASSIGVMESGLYTMTVNDEDCAITVSMEVVFIELPEPTISQDGNTLTCDQEGFQYQWYLDGVIISGATSQSYDALEDGNYTVDIAQEECIETSSPYTFIYNGIDTGSAIPFSIYPNPANEVLFVKSNMNGNFYIEIYDAAGYLVQTHRLENTSAVMGNPEYFNNRYEIKTMQLSNGHYYFTLKNQAQLYRQSFIVMH